MSYNDLVTKLDQMEEATAIADIAYLPSNLSSVKKSISDLSKMKLDWNIEILEKDGSKEVQFEDSLSIDVPSEHWDNFLTIFDGILENGYLNLREMLFEAMEDERNNLVQELRPTLIRAFTNPPFDQVEEDLNRWKAKFRVDSYKKQKVPVSYSTKQHDLMKMYKNLLESYKDDVGSMEMLIEAFRDKTPLSTFDVFKHYDYIYGGRIRSTFLGTTMMFEGTIDMTFVISETVFIEDQDIVDAVEEDIFSVKVVDRVIYPKGERFNPEFYRGLYNIIEDTIE
jgi:hypothetical protein